MWITNSSLEFGRVLRARRRELGYSQIDLAAEAGVSRGFISRLERGEGGPALGDALRCASILGLNMTLSRRGDDRP